MSDDRTTQAEQLIARMKAARRYIYPEWELAARTDPDFTDAYNRIYELALGEGRHVSAKVREFVAIALLAFRGAERDSLVAHDLRRPHRVDLQEFQDALQMLAVASHARAQGLHVLTGRLKALRRGRD